MKRNAQAVSTIDLRPFAVLMLGSALALAPFAAMAQTAAPVPAPADHAAHSAAPAGAAFMKATLKTAEGADVGMVEVHEAAAGGSHLVINLKGLPAGVFAAHVHETGKCEAPKFESAGPHLSGGKQHGIRSAEGAHAGDLPNIHVPASGEITVEYFAPALTAELLKDADGSAFIVHGAADDYKSQPAGDAGARAACGVLEAA